LSIALKFFIFQQTTEIQIVMFNLFKKKETASRIEDLEGSELKAGDHVLSLRYDLGECTVLQGESGLEYQSITKGTKVHYARMVDASTGRQKVRKLS
jgi:hypothetical protein